MDGGQWNVETSPVERVRKQDLPDLRPLSRAESNCVRGGSERNPSEARAGERVSDGHVELEKRGQV